MKTFFLLSLIFSFALTLPATAAVLTNICDVVASEVPPEDPYTGQLWVDTSLCDFEEQQNHSRSRLNHEEAKLLMKTLMEYVKVIGMEHLLREQTDFGIISPYKGQVRLLRKYLRNNKMLKPLRKQISVNTVDGFQGQERDVILISMVRDNTSGSIGFLNDLRRMNVAITRARMKLIMFGNAETLGKTKFYEKLVEYFEERGAFIQEKTNFAP